MTACKKPQQTPPLRTAVQVQTPIPAQAMSDQQLVESNHSHGLGLGLRMPVTTIKVGEPVPLRILVENLKATEPIGSRLCTGLFFSYQNVANSDTGGIDIADPGCKDVHLVDPPLPKGKLITVERTGAGAPHIGLLPGIYTVSLRWVPTAISNGAVLQQATYAELASNEFTLTVTK